MARQGRGRAKRHDIDRPAGSGMADEAPGRLLKVHKVSQLVAQDIRSRIARGEIADGDVLAPEPELIQQYGVSRPTLREAIRILETEGLVTTTRGGPKGARVHHPDSGQAARHAGLLLQLRGATIMDVFELASILVPPAARKVAERSPPADISGLCRLHDEMARASQSPRVLARLIRQFDMMLCSLSGNEALKLTSQMMAAIIELQIDMIPVSAADLPEENMRDIAPARARFGAVIAAIEAGDGALAESLMRDRLQEMMTHHRRLEAGAKPLRVLS